MEKVVSNVLFGGPLDGAAAAYADGQRDDLLVPIGDRMGRYTLYARLRGDTAYGRYKWEGWVVPDPEHPGEWKFDQL